MEAKHTPGPWKLHVGLDFINIYGPYLSDEVLADTPWPVHDEKAMGDAYLMTSALALYESAADILPDIENEVDQRKYSGNDEDWRDLERKANALRAALAEARGETTLGKAA
jgi:hypothetical protein